MRRSVSRAYLGEETDGVGQQSSLLLLLLSLVRLGHDVVEPLEFVSREDVVERFAYEAHRQHLQVSTTTQHCDQVSGVAASGVRRMNEVNARRARLVPNSALLGLKLGLPALPESITMFCENGFSHFVCINKTASQVA